MNIKDNHLQIIKILIQIHYIPSLLSELNWNCAQLESSYSGWGTQVPLPQPLLPRTGLVTKLELNVSPQTPVIKSKFGEVPLEPCGEEESSNMLSNSTLC